jgi:hypothetical protein
MSDFVPLNKLITALKAATSSGKSGAFFITTQDQHSAMVTLKGGAITGIKFRNTRGHEAAAALAKIESLKYQSAAEPTELPGESALNTATVLEILTTGEAAAPAAEPGAGGAPPAIDIEQVRRRYIDSIGPIGGALCDEAVEELGERLSTSDGAKELVDKLIEQIDDEAEAKAFRKDVGV